MVDPMLGGLEIIRTISSNDRMYTGDEGHYFWVGLSALECINVSLQAAGKSAADVRDILDLPSGHGRVLRYLKAGFPAAQITACDLMRDGVDFCASTFSAVPVYSHDDPARIPLKKHGFDLIWVGSLFTHFDAGLWLRFLEAFRASLRPGGLLVFSTHGEEAYRLLVTDRTDYLIPYYRKTAICYKYERDGFGFVRYPDSIVRYSDSNSYYGLSFSSPAWVLDQVARLGGLRIVHFSEKAWANHHDCFACVHEPDWHHAQANASTYMFWKHQLREVIKPKEE